MRGSRVTGRSIEFHKQFSDHVVSAKIVITREHDEGFITDKLALVYAPKRPVVVALRLQDIEPFGLGCTN